MKPTWTFDEGLAQYEFPKDHRQQLLLTFGKPGILKLRADVEKREGPNFNLEKYHDGFMQHGFAPIAIVRREMLLDDSPVSIRWPDSVTSAERVDCFN